MAIESVYSLNFNDHRGFTVAYNRFYLPLYYFTKKIVTDPEIAKDITADAFIKLWRQAQEGEPVQNVNAFLHTTARNAAINHIHTQKLHQDKKKELYHLAEQDDRTALQMAEIKSELLLYIQEEIEKLPSKARQIFKLSFIEGMKNNEIAALLGISERTVINQKVVSLKKLRIAFQNRQWLWALLLFVFYHE